MSLCASAAKIGDHFARSLERAVRATQPFEHWRIEDALPLATCKALVALPPSRAERRNESRFLFSADNRGRFPVVDDIAAAFQCRATVRELEELCGAELRGSSLRIEYRPETDGFRPEPDAELLTMLVGLSEKHIGAGLIFVPGRDAAAKFDRQPIEGFGRSLVVNYVKPEWRARHELAYPNTPVG
jgi:hypothetical protein